MQIPFGWHIAPLRSAPLAARPHWYVGLARAHPAAIAEWETAPHPPRTRADCEPGSGWPRPCPAYRCRYCTPYSPGSCALDVAEEGGVALERVGEVLDVSRQRAQQVERMAMRRARIHGWALKVDINDLTCDLAEDTAEGAGELDNLYTDVAKAYNRVVPARLRGLGSLRAPKEEP